MTRTLARNNATKHEMVTITLPIRVDVLERTAGTRPHLLESQLVRKDEGLALLALFEGMRAANSEISNTSGHHRPVANYADVARFIMQTICDAVAPAEDSAPSSAIQADDPAGEEAVAPDVAAPATEDIVDAPPIQRRKK